MSLAAAASTDMEPDDQEDAAAAQLPPEAEVSSAMEMGAHAGMGNADDAQLAAALAATASGDEPPTATEERRSRSRSPRREGH